MSQYAFALSLKWLLVLENCIAKSIWIGVHVKGNNPNQNISDTLLTLHCDGERNAEAGKQASTTGRQPNLPRNHPGHASHMETHLEVVAARSVRKLGL